jgi:phosphoribosyl-ATP pyrophosphohydrolase/phosphoribosyl-AMP cyclohydrolase
MTAMVIDNTTLQFDENGLIPVIVQSYNSGKVLMLAYANLAALESTKKSGFATFYSRSRKELWEKGATSGNRQKIVDIRVDCDQDSLLYIVEESGPACHTNNESCFYRSLSGEDVQKPSRYEIFSELYKKIEGRKNSDPSESYVARLFQKGTDKVVQKIGEEATETVIALKNDDHGEKVLESSDLIFHLLVGLVDQNVPLSDIEDELLKRYK